MKRILVVCLVLGFVACFANVSHATWFGADVSTSLNAYSNSHNDNSVRDNKVSTYSSNTNSNNRYDNHANSNNKTDSRSYRYDFDNHAISDSYNTDNSSYQTISDSFKGNSFDDSVGKRTASHDISGTVSNSVIGDFNQKIGTDFSGGFAGSASTIEAAVTNTQTFGNVNVNGSDK